MKQAIDRRMTVREAAKVLGCNPETVKRHIRELWPNLMQNGVTTYLNEAHITVLLEKIKQGQAYAHNVSGGDVAAYKSGIAGIETSQSLDLQLALVARKAHELWKRKALEQEARAVRAELELITTKSLLTERETGLSTYQRIAESGGLVLSDRDDLTSAYRGRM